MDTLTNIVFKRHKYHRCHAGQQTHYATKQSTNEHVTLWKDQKKYIIKFDDNAKDTENIKKLIISIASRCNMYFHRLL